MILDIKDFTLETGRDGMEGDYRRASDCRLDKSMIAAVQIQFRSRPCLKGPCIMKYLDEG